MNRERRGARIAVGTAVAILAGCGAGSTDPAPPPSQPPAGTQRAIRIPAPGPPSRPPTASLAGGHAGRLIYAAWATGPRTRPPTGIGVARRRLSPFPRGPFVVRLGTNRPPSRLTLRAYPRVDRAGTPSGRATTLECLPRPYRARCGYPARIAPSRTTVPVTVSKLAGRASAALIVNAAWYVPRRMRDRDPRLPLEASVAWAFRFRADPQGARRGAATAG